MMCVGAAVFSVLFWNRARNKNKRGFMNMKLKSKLKQVLFTATVSIVAMSLFAANVFAFSEYGINQVLYILNINNDVATHTKVSGDGDIYKLKWVTGNHPTIYDVYDFNAWVVTSNGTTVTNKKFFNHSTKNQDYTTILKIQGVSVSNGTGLIMRVEQDNIGQRWLKGTAYFG
jgi:hypothetical protein